MKSYRSEVLHGLALGLASFVWICLEYAAGFHTTRIAQHPVVSNFFAPIPIYLIYRALRVRRDSTPDGTLTWAQGLRSGMVVSLVVGLCAAPTIVVFTRFINPRYFAAMIECAVTYGHSTRASAERYFTVQSYILQSTIAPLVMGAITALIATAILRRRRRVPATA